jgi:dihydrofolate reductase
MSKVTLYIATSIDGYIARPDGSLDWLDAIPNPDKTDHGYMELLENTSHIIMGRKTYSALLGFGIEWPYSGKKTFVASNDKSFHPQTPETEKLGGDLTREVTKIKAEADRDIWLVGGGQLVTCFLNNDLIDKMIIAIAPIILGEGIALFPERAVESQWTLKEHIAYSTGIICLTYIKK